MEIYEAIEHIRDRGWVRVPDVYSEQLCESVKEEFYKRYEDFKEVQRKKNIEDSVKNATHHTLVLCREMLKLVDENKASPILEEYFEGKYILNTMGLSLIPPEGGVYTQNIHRDQRSFSGSSNLWINTLIMLDDSTSENGATWILEGSHKNPKQPDEDYFFKNAIRAEGKKGDVLLFDGNIWHSAGENKTNKTRHIITPIYSRPFIKQQLDYPRAFGPDFEKTISSHLKQVLGYNALTPVTLFDFYQSDEDRFYKKDQG